MKVIYIECNEDELRANRTMLDNLADAFSAITRAIGGVDVTPEMVGKAIADSEDDAESEDE